MNFYALLGSTFLVAVVSLSAGADLVVAGFSPIAVLVKHLLTPGANQDCPDVPLSRRKQLKGILATLLWLSTCLSQQQGKVRRAGCR